MENKIKEMYSKYTYPKYNKNMDNLFPNNLTRWSPNLFLEQINYYIFNGEKKNFNNFKCLVAGVGLGNDLINIGLFLNKYKNVELIGIDLSKTSLNILSFNCMITVSSFS